MDRVSRECIRSRGHVLARRNFTQKRNQLKEFFILKEVVSSRAYQQQVYEESQMVVWLVRKRKVNRCGSVGTHSYAGQLNKRNQGLLGGSWVLMGRM
ncbi:hypothetical protein NDU88_006250 [Pleurodeles waltl]|uniref:Uncharacterized protein n=1 Tax=Pleurodeles waltl TaxID=8319 RepID=A0AAV7RPC0_PLEWA|nr:hypothetical protein NDU88_006250 [Pleurodeles waltl]